MTFRRHSERSRVIARLLAFSLCVSAPFSGSVFAQSSPQKSQFRDARLLSILADDDENASDEDSRVVPAVHRETKNASKSANIRATSAASKKSATNTSGAKTTRSNARAIAQAQYATAPTAQVTEQAFGDNLQATDGPFEDVCLDPHKLPPITELPYKVFIPETNVPESCPLNEGPYQRKAPTPITFTWKASSLCYKPLYFEDVQLERYGHYCSPWLQPALSRVCFLVKIPALPYFIGVDPPNQCIYDLGYYRPGNCAPSMVEPLPISLRGGLYEAGAIVGAAAVIP